MSSIFTTPKPVCVSYKLNNSMFSNPVLFRIYHFKETDRLRETDIILRDIIFRNVRHNILRERRTPISSFTISRVKALAKTNTPSSRHGKHFIVSPLSWR